ncbi:MAG: ankyrin repeat domain-containing protein [Hormoscilla sp. GUM202]|nr:ankyrin repeat domain-containing protein [Hormoscilla sp. GUM202]
MPNWDAPGSDPSNALCISGLYGASLEAQDGKGWTALMMAAAHGHAEVVQVLLEHGAELKAQDDRGSTALMMAESSNYPDRVNLLKKQLNIGKNY